MNNNLLEKSIFKTLSYFDIFDHPLTKEELFFNLWEPPKIKYDYFLEYLKNNQEKVYSEKFGYFFLKNKENTIEVRRSSLIFSDLKMKIARRAIKKIRSIPFLRAVFICNNVGSGRAGDKSDIDLFVVSEIGRLWIVRFFVNFILRIFGLRTYGTKTKNKICVSFLVDNHNLSLSNLRIVKNDIHFAYWINEMIPIYDPKDLYKKFIFANKWTKDYLPNLNQDSNYLKDIKDGFFGLFFKKIWETMWKGAYGDLIEKQAKSFQLAKMKLNIKEKAKLNNNCVVLSDSVIKLHENDARLKYKKIWEEKIKI